MMTRTPVAVIRLNASNDRNGNPRRVFVGFTKNGGVIAAYDEGYSGERAMPETWRKRYAGLTFDTTPSEYRDLIRTYGKAPA